MKRLFALLTLTLLMAGEVLAQPAQRFFGSIVRPDNATPYTAGDAVGSSADSVILRIIAPGSGVKGKIVAAKLSLDSINVANGTFRLFFLEDTTGYGLIVDNAAFAPTQAKDSLSVGVTDFTLEVTGTATATAAFDYNTGLDIRFNAGGPLYAFLTATGAFTPKTKGRYDLWIWVE